MSDSSSLAKKRLLQERKQWRKDHPHAFFARPSQHADGSMNIMVWECGIPGKAGTKWAGGLYPIRIEVCGFAFFKVLGLKGEEFVLERSRVVIADQFRRGLCCVFSLLTPACCFCPSLETTTLADLPR